MNPDLNRQLLSEAIVRVARADRDALQAVYRLTSAKLFGVCLRILADRSEAEDVLQEVYLTVWNKAQVFDAARASPITWLIAIARNRSIDRLRARGGSRRMEPIEIVGEIADETPLADSQMEASQASLQLRRCLEGLGSNERVALQGAFFDGNTYEELAQRLGVPDGTMKSWIRRALIKLKACLTQ